MNNADYGFLFKPAGNEQQGPANPSEEIFKGRTSHAQALCRELGQNSLDAVFPQDNRTPVRMEFQLKRMRVTDIPDIESLKRHFQSSSARYPDDPGLNTALKTLSSEYVNVLRVGDYGTTGLTGSESIKDHNSALAALTRGSGVSVGKTDEGGSYGIGKSVGLLTSLSRTEFWTTRPHDSDKTIFAGCSQMTTHQNPNTDDPLDQLGPMGIYTSTADSRDYHYSRDIEHLGPFPTRTAAGTDVYIIGYSEASSDPRLLDIRNAMIDNFMAAIMRGRLEVAGQGEQGDSWTLDSSTLKQTIDTIMDNEQKVTMRAFYQALCETPIVKEDALLGEMKLYVNIDDSLPKKLNTIAMRAPLMKVSTYRNTSIFAKYAAVLECSSPKGNHILRGMEPVSHDAWQENRDPQNGKAAISTIKNFIRKELQKCVRRELGEEMRIKGLNTLLPAELQIRGDITQHAGRPSNGPGSEKESSSLQGKPAKSQTAGSTSGKSVHISLSESAVAGQGEAEVSTGQNRGGSGTHTNSTPTKPASGHNGKGSSEIDGKELSMRYWYDSKLDDYIIILRSKSGKASEGTLKLLAALDGSFGSYSPDIESAVDITNGNNRPLTINERGISPVMVKGKEPTRLRIHINSSIRLQLGVE